LGSAYYAGRLILQPPHYLTTSERLEILETHPSFTSICPTCGAGLAEDERMHCNRCGWREEIIA
jgi:predicted amidophosphoribosyltransferase